jgi:hypothetical protein
MIAGCCCKTRPACEGGFDLDSEDVSVCVAVLLPPVTRLSPGAAATPAPPAPAAAATLVGVPSVGTRSTTPPPPWLPSVGKKCATFTMAARVCAACTATSILSSWDAACQSAAAFAASVGPRTMVLKRPPEAPPPAGAGAVGPQRESAPTPALMLLPPPTAVPSLAAATAWRTRSRAVAMVLGFTRRDRS